MWNFEKYSKKVACITEFGQWTYGQIDSLAEEFAQYVPKRSLILILCRNTPGSLFSYLCSMKTDCVPLLLPANMDMDAFKEMMCTYHPNYLCVPKDMAEVFSMEKRFELEDYVVLHAFEEKVEMHEKLGLLLSTSGSTGSPKLVRQSKENVEANARQIAEYLELKDDERPITTMPMNYTYGLSIINSHLLVGAVLLLTNRTLFETEFWEFFKKEKATSFGAVPYTYKMLKRLRFTKMDLPDLRYFTQAGGKLSLELHQEYAEYAKSSGKKFIVMYGQTEATARMSYLPWEKSLEKIGSIGIAIPEGRFSLRDVNNQEISEPDMVGELIYEGPNVTLGYARKQEDLILGDERMGVLITGDMAKKDEDGYYYIVGRKKRFIKVFGNRMNLDEMELAINKNCNVESAICGEDDFVEVYVVKGGEILPVEKYLQERFHLHPSAYAVKEVDEIPKNDSGKILYSKLMEGREK